MKIYFFILLINFYFILINSLVIEKKIEHECPRIVTRQEWNARNVTGHQLLWTRPVPYVVIHHGGILHYCYDIKECSVIVKSYQDLHIDTNKWIDIGYNFVIGEDGNIYEGRGWDFVGAHAPGFNTQSIGISIIGDFSHFNPNKNALRALTEIIKCGVLLNKISINYQVIGHRQARITACPGEVFYNYVQLMPRWTSTPVSVYVDANTYNYSNKSNNDSSLNNKIDEKN